MGYFIEGYVNYIHGCLWVLVLLRSHSTRTFNLYYDYTNACCCSIVMAILMLGIMFVYLLDTSKGVDEFCVNMAIHVGRIRAWSNEPIFHSPHDSCYVFDLWKMLARFMIQHM